MAKEIKKVVLAYSGGLDTSIIIPFIFFTGTIYSFKVNSP